jgi:molybdopterin synthase catalytic subunit
MTITVLLFAGLRERAHAGSIEVRLPHDPSDDEPPTVAELRAYLAMQHPELAPLLGPCRFAVDEVFVGEGDIVASGASVALIPPVSGGHDDAVADAVASDGPAVALFATPFAASWPEQRVQHEGAGGVCCFRGHVRRHSRGTTVERLEYEAYGPMALRAMATIVREIEAAIPGARVAIAHRTGQLEVGELAVAIAASAPHRDEAFRACRAAIEQLKRDVPIWKREVGSDGAEWIGQGP